MANVNLPVKKKLTCLKEQIIQTEYLSLCIGWLLDLRTYNLVYFNHARLILVSEFDCHIDCGRFLLNQIFM